MEPLLTVHREDRIPWQRIKASRNIDFEENPLQAVSDEPAMIHRALREKYHLRRQRVWNIHSHGWEADGTFMLLFRAEYHGHMAAEIDLPMTVAALTYHRCIGVLVDWKTEPGSRSTAWCYSKAYEKLTHSLHVFHRNKRILRLNLEEGRDRIQRIVQVSKALVCRIARDKPDEPVEATVYSVEAIANFDTRYGERYIGQSPFYREQPRDVGVALYRQSTPSYLYDDMTDITAPDGFDANANVH